MSLAMREMLLSSVQESMVRISDNINVEVLKKIYGSESSEMCLDYLHFSQYIEFVDALHNATQVLHAENYEKIENFFQFSDILYNAKDFSHIEDYEKLVDLSKKFKNVRSLKEFFQSPEVSNLGLT